MSWVDVGQRQLVLSLKFPEKGFLGAYQNSKLFFFFHHHFKHLRPKKISKFSLNNNHRNRKKIKILFFSCLTPLQRLWNLKIFWKTNWDNFKTTYSFEFRFMPETHCLEGLFWGWNKGCIKGEVESVTKRPLNIAKNLPLLSRFSKRLIIMTSNFHQRFSV